MYTIGQISTLFNLPISTLRYYDKEGLFPNLVRKGNIRLFSDNDIEALHLIECLKQTGLEIKDIKRFMNLVKEGSSTYKERKEIIETQKLKVEENIKQMEKNLALLKFKCWYYETAIKDNSETNIKKMMPNNLPDDIQKLYNKAHTK